MQVLDIDSVVSEVIQRGWKQVVVVGEDSQEDLRLARLLQQAGVQCHLVEPGVPFDDLPYDGLIYGKDRQEAQRQALQPGQYLLSATPLVDQVASAS